MCMCTWLRSVGAVVVQLFGCLLCRACSVMFVAVEYVEEAKKVRLSFTSAMGSGRFWLDG